MHHSTQKKTMSSRKNTPCNNDDPIIHTLLSLLELVAGASAAYDLAQLHLREKQQGNENAFDRYFGNGRGQSASTRTRVTAAVQCKGRHEAGFHD